MTETNDIELRGCSPEPLMAYLKALGVFRLVAEQRDPSVRARWADDVFILRTKLSRDDLANFLLEEYRPTPIVAPWNGGSGFYPKDNKHGMNTILESEHPRFADWRQIIHEAQRVVDRMPDERSSAKEWILTEVRNTLPDAALDWLDATYVLTDQKPRYPPLLGTGGNDGRLDFSNNFMQNVVTSLGLDQQGGSRRRRGPRFDPDQLLREALYGDSNPSLVPKRSTGQFNPGGIGGSNATTGFTADSLSNPWDFVLMIEGALCFAGAAARKLSAQSQSKAVFPFTVDTSAAGYGTAVESEYSANASRAEFWAPLWLRDSSFREVSHFMSEGRAQLGNNQASNGAEFARSIVGLGVERGIREFQRFGFFKRNGLAFIATPLGRFKVDEDEAGSSKANVLFDLDAWLNGLRRVSRGPNASESLRRAMRTIDRAVIQFCQRPDARRLQEVLIAVGSAERQLGVSASHDARPLHGLSPEWLAEADDGSPEFRLAAALASISSSGGVGPIRVNLEPVNFGPLGWNKSSVSHVWRGGKILESMVDVLERRCLESRQAGTPQLALRSPITASLNHIQAFLEDRLDVQRIADLLPPLACVRWSNPLPDELRQKLDDWSITSRDQLRLPQAYAAMKLLYLPHNFNVSPYGSNVSIKPEPALLRLLRGGKVGEAHKLASRRLRASGLSPLTLDAGLSPSTVMRLAAALVFPINEYHGDRTLAEISLKKPDTR